MALFTPRTYPEIIGEMIARLTAYTPLTDVNFGSVWTTMLEAAAQEDDEQYFSMLEIIRGYSLDTVSGSDLDDRAFEYGLERLPAQSASTLVTIGDTSITKVSTGVYSGFAGAASGSLSINGDSGIGFPTTGSIIIGRGTPNSETVTYSSITDNGNYVTFNLSSGLANDHGTDEDIILSQGGTRVVSAGTVVIVPASDLSPQIDFTLDEAVSILDGERETTAVAVTATETGAASNVPVGSIINFDSPPFATAYVTNPARVTNGKDEETDQELRDRIKATIQSLSRGTGRSIITGVSGVISTEENKRVVSASIIEPTIPADVVKLFIDDGTGFIPKFTKIGFETVVDSATGGEKFLKTKNFPIVKAFVETQNQEPFALFGGEELFVDVGGRVETVLFLSTDFAIPGQATAQEVLIKLNAQASLYEARVSSDGTKVRIFSRSNFDEQITVTGGTANSPLNFVTDQKYTTKLYLKRNNAVSLLSKDGVTASIESGATAAYDISGFDHNFCIIVDGTSSLQYAHFRNADYLEPENLTAQLVANALNAQISGMTASTSSNNTKVTLTSNVKRDSSSGIRVVENFSKVLRYNGSFIDITSAAQTNSSNVSIFPANNNYIYVGHTDVKFRSIFFALATPASSTMGFIAQFYNELTSSWTTFSPFDGTSGFTQNGLMTFEIPSSWGKTTIDGTEAYWVRIQRNQVTLTTPPVESRIKICSMNEILEFSETPRVGADSDYTINRFIGQIELKSPLNPFDQLTLGSYETRAAIVSGQGAYGLFGGEALYIKVDGVAQTITFSPSDFFTVGSALPQEVANRLNADLLGASAELVDSNTRIKITTNKYDGTLEVTGGNANTVLQFPLTQAASLVSHIPSVESAAGPYSFPQNSELIVIMNGNAANNLTIPCYRNGTTTSGTTASIVIDTSLSTVFPTSAALAGGYEVLMTSGSESGNRRDVASYDPLTGALTLASAFSSTPGIGEDYQLIAKNAVTLARLWNNTQITLISIYAEVRASSGGTKVQIASLIAGEDASVQVAGGTANAILAFTTNKILGIDGYRHFTGLAQVTQWTVDGRDDDSDNYPGIRAAGVQVEVLEPVTRPIEVEVDVTPREGVTLSSISSEVKTAISSYINTLPVGADVIVSEITVAVKGVSGVFDVIVSVPSANIAIADNELARVKESDIIVG